MEEVKLRVKELKDPDFASCEYEGKNLIVHYRPPVPGPGSAIYFGKAIADYHRTEVSLEGFSLMCGRPSPLEKQIIFGEEYAGFFPFCGTPLNLPEHFIEGREVYEFESEVDIDELRVIVNSHEKRLVVNCI